MTAEVYTAPEEENLSTRKHRGNKTAFSTQARALFSIAIQTESMGKDRRGKIQKLSIAT